MHLPRTVLTIALAASTATALPGWRSKTNKDDVKCEGGTCAHGDRYQKGQGQVKEFYQQRQHEPRSERGGGGTRGPWNDYEGNSPVSTGNDRVVGKDHGPYDNGVRVVGDDHGPYENGLRVVGKDHGPYDNNARVVGKDHGPYDNNARVAGKDHGPYDNNARVVGDDHGPYDNGLFTKGGDDFYQGGNGDKKGGNKLSEVKPDNQWYQGGDKKGVSPRNFHNQGPKMRYEKEEGKTPYQIEYTNVKGGQGSGHVIPRHVETEDKENDSKDISYVKGGVVEPRNYHTTGKQHYETGKGQWKEAAVEPRNFHQMGKIHFETGNGEQKEAVTGNGHQHFWTRHVERPTSGDDFAQTKPTEGGDEFVAGRRPTKTDTFVNTKNQGGDEFVAGRRPTKTDTFVNTKNQGGDEFVAGRRPTKTDTFVNTKNQGGDEFVNGGRRSNPDDFAQVKAKGGDDFYTSGRTKGDDFSQVKTKGGDDFHTGSRNKGGDEIDYSRGQRGGSTQNEISYQQKQPRDVKNNGGVWKESSSKGCFEIYGKGPKGESTYIKCL